MYDLVKFNGVSMDKVRLNGEVVWNKSVIPTFESATWAEVDTIASSGNASDYWSIGDTKTFELSTGEEIEVRIADFNHDTLSTGGTAGITLEMTHALADTVTMNTTATNVGGWEESRLRTTDIPLRLAEFPTDLQAIIKPVKKLTQAGNMSSELTETIDSIWLFSYTEIGGVATAYSPSGEGTVYPLFVDNDSRIKNIGIDGSPDIWWTRSPYLGADTYFCYSTGTGAFYRNNANTSRGVALGFCVGGLAVGEIDIFNAEEAKSLSYWNTDYAYLAWEIPTVEGRTYYITMDENNMNAITKPDDLRTIYASYFGTAIGEASANGANTMIGNTSSTVSSAQKTYFEFTATDEPMYLNVYPKLESDLERVFDELLVNFRIYYVE